MTSPESNDRDTRSWRTIWRRAKIAVTLPKQLLARARGDIWAREAASLGALVPQALEEKLERDRLQEVLDEMAAQYGPLKPEEMAWADRVLNG